MALSLGCGDQPTKPKPGGGGGLNAPPVAQTDYRERYNRYLESIGVDRLPSDWDAHHRIPQIYRDHPEFTDFDFDHPDNIRVVSSGRGISVATHSQVTEVWGNWQDDNPNPTREQIEQMADAVDETFEDDWWPPDNE
jgi:hypothetical protein